MFEIKATIFKIFPTYQVSMDKHYRQLWIETHETNPQFIRMQLSGELCKVLDTMKIGDKVNIVWSISGRPRMKGDDWELYNNLNVEQMNLID